MGDKDKEINVQNVLDMLNLHEKTSPASESPQLNLRSQTARSVVVTVDKFKELFTTDAEEMKKDVTEKSNLAVVVNSIVRVMTEVMETVSEHGASSKNCLKT